MRNTALALLLLLTTLGAGRARASNSNVLDAAQILNIIDALLPTFFTDRLEDLVRVAAEVCSSIELPAAEELRAEAGSWSVVWYSLRRGTVSWRELSAARAARLVGEQRVAIYVGGWGNAPTDEAARALAAALLRDHGAVLALDTRRAFARGYAAAAREVPAVASALVALCAALARHGVSARAVHVVGFSLGAHVAGATGRLLQRRGARLGRITALDPARPCFTRGAGRLRRSDARFVLVVHSSSGALGLARALGHADVYVNGVAGRQAACGAPGTRALHCAHSAAWRAAAAEGQRARRCDDLGAAKSRRCEGPTASVSLTTASETMRGVYLLEWPTRTESNASTIAAQI